MLINAFECLSLFAPFPLQNYDQRIFELQLLSNIKSSVNHNEFIGCSKSIILLFDRSQLTKNSRYLNHNVKSHFFKPPFKVTQFSIANIFRGPCGKKNLGVRYEIINPLQIYNAQNKAFRFQKAVE